MPPTTQDVDWSLNSLLRVLDAHHITQALTYSLRGKFYDFVSGNTETMRAAEMHPNITGVATIDPRRYFGCEEEVERCVDMGFHVFRFFPDEQGWSIASLPFLRLCERMAEHQVAVLMPAGSWGEQTRMARLLEPFGFPVVAIGATFDVIAESIAVAARNEHFYVETSQMHIVDSISGFVREVGATKLMFGSAAPERSFASAYGLVSGAMLNDDSSSQVFAGNARKVLLGDNH